MSQRSERVAHQIRDELAGMVQREIKDPRIGFATITEVVLSTDLRVATVRVSSIGSREELEATIQGLVSARGWIRHELGRRLSNLRYSPELRFEADHRIAEAQRISDLLREVLPDSATGEPAAE
ncbi:MAG: 30S ribosome-binding factor RbfA [Candidatus Dormibacteria bacterium]